MRGRRNWLGAYAALVFGFLYLPVFILVVLSFNSSRTSAIWKGFTLDWYVRLFHNRLLWEAVQNSLIIATATAVIATTLGTAAALALHRRQVRGRLWVEGLLYLPLVLPDIVLGVGALVLFTALGIQLGLGTMLAAHVGTSISYVVLVLRARLSDMDERLEEAARDLGATPWQTIRHVTLPLLAPGILAAVLLSFTLSLDDFILSFFTAGPGSTTLPLRVYGMMKTGLTPEVNALSTVMLLVTAVATTLFQRLTQNRIF
ncbi:MAG: ABC transporter permease subunit [Symbiobacterium sp.]|uniref:ABC transporter permease n=1 Tax=Symbiobacterium sp. TaxID=1971213 RepID=UPI003464A9BB